MILIIIFNYMIFEMPTKSLRFVSIIKCKTTLFKTFNKINLAYCKSVPLIKGLASSHTQLSNSSQKESQKFFIFRFFEVEVELVKAALDCAGPRGLYPSTYFILLFLILFNTLNINSSHHFRQSSP